MNKIVFPLADRDDIKNLCAGEKVEISGIIYTARDRVHAVCTSEGRWPFPLAGAAVYYSGPTPPKPGFPLGSCGPTTSARMDAYAPEMYNSGLTATIGKGPRSKEVVEAIRRNKAVYLVAFGGCGSYYGSKIKKAEIIAYPDFGPQAVYKVVVDGFTVIVGIDSKGESLFDYGNTEDIAYNKT